MFLQSPNTDQATEDSAQRRGGSILNGNPQQRTLHGVLMVRVQYIIKFVIFLVIICFSDIIIIIMSTL